MNIRKLNSLFVLIFALAFLTSCNNHANIKQDPNADTPREAKLREAGLVNIAELDTTIMVHLVYATPYNFMGRRLYHGLNKAFMLPDLADKLIKAQKLLKKLRPDLTLIVYDAARPIEVQREMWAMVEGTDMEDFVANPTKRPGMHNIAAAVDVTLVDCTGHPLPMGSEYDYFGDDARTTDEEKLLKDGRITIREYENRLLLRKVMTESGLKAIDEEWWHFDLMEPKKARELYKAF
ncbi:MAG: M15 family metallopeptidase [Bacteroidia bacterium]|nr:M15 family metallopeptidase [Bacteroidia bacterium]